MSWLNLAQATLHLRRIDGCSFNRARLFLRNAIGAGHLTVAVHGTAATAKQIATIGSYKWIPGGDTYKIIAPVLFNPPEAFPLVQTASLERLISRRGTLNSDALRDPPWWSLVHAEEYIEAVTGGDSVCALEFLRSELGRTIDVCWGLPSHSGVHVDQELVDGAFPFARAPLLLAGSGCVIDGEELRPLLVRRQQVTEAWPDRARASLLTLRMLPSSPAMKQFERFEAFAARTRDRQPPETPHHADEGVRESEPQVGAKGRRGGMPSLKEKFWKVLDGFSREQLEGYQDEIAVKALTKLIQDYPNLGTDINEIEHLKIATAKRQVSSYLKQRRRARLKK